MKEHKTKVIPQTRISHLSEKGSQPYDLHLRADEANGMHTRFTVFINKGNCGQLCMREDEAVFFHNLIIQSHFRLSRDTVRSSGKWKKEKP